MGTLRPNKYSKYHKKYSKSIDPKTQHEKDTIPDPPKPQKAWFYYSKTHVFKDPCYPSKSSKRPQNEPQIVPKWSQEATKEVREAHSWLTKAAGQPNSCLTKPLVKQTMVNFFGWPTRQSLPRGNQPPRIPKSTSKKWKLLPKLFKIGMPVLTPLRCGQIWGTKAADTWNHRISHTDLHTQVDLNLRPMEWSQEKTGNDFEPTHDDNSTMLTLWKKRLSYPSQRAS